MVSKQKQQRYEEALMNEMEDLQADDSQDSQDEQMMNTHEFQDGIGVPEPDQQFNKHSFLFSSLDQDKLEKVTYFSESELGRPLFNVRFILSIESLAHHHLDLLCYQYGVPNKIASYFRQKVDDISATGMSNQGFLQKLNVTQKMDMTRKRIRNLGNLKGGSGQTVPTNE